MVSVDRSLELATQLFSRSRREEKNACKSEEGKKYVRVQVCTLAFLYTIMGSLGTDWTNSCFSIRCAVGLNSKSLMRHLRGAHNHPLHLETSTLHLSCWLIRFNSSPANILLAFKKEVYFPSLKEKYTS